MPNALNHEILLVDGYNVANHWLSLGFLKKGELEFLRHQLITLLSNVVGYWEIDSLLVFDAHLVKGNKESWERVSPHLSVLFTAEGQTADATIERLAGDLLKMQKTVLVCTSDGMEQNIILTRGANRISAREFLIEVKQAQRDLSLYKSQPACMQRNWLEDALKPEVRWALKNMGFEKS